MDNLFLVLDLIDEYHSLDPNIEQIDGMEIPSELLYADRMEEMLKEMVAEPSDEQLLAARCQHFKRWEVPREQFPMDKAGYYAWRKEVSKHQSEEIIKLLKESGAGKKVAAKVTAMIDKTETTDDAQLIEDVTCLSFFKYYGLEFAGKHEPEKVGHIVAKTLSKMSRKGKKKLMDIDLPEAIKTLVTRLLEDDKISD